MDREKIYHVGLIHMVYLSIKFFKLIVIKWLLSAYNLLRTGKRERVLC